MSGSPSTGAEKEDPFDFIESLIFSLSPEEGLAFLCGLI